MSWVSVAQGEDVPAGTKVRIAYRAEVPAWLEWTPDVLMDWIMRTLANAWANLQGYALTQKLKLERYEVNVVQTGKLYEVVFYGESRGAIPWLVAVALIALIGLIVIATVWVYSVDKLGPAVVGLGLGAIILWALLFMGFRLPKREGEHG